MDNYNDEGKEKKVTVDDVAPPPAYQPYFSSDGASVPAGNTPYYQQGPTQVFYTTSAADYYGNPSVVVVTQPQPNPQHYVPVKQSFCCHIFWSCFAFWLCGIVFGLISFVLAIFARKSSEQGNHSEANRLGKASMSLTIIGILLGCAAWGFVIWYLVTYFIYGFWYGGHWYRYKICGVTNQYCSNYYDGDAYDFYTSCCYYD